MVEGVALAEHSFLLFSAKANCFFQLITLLKQDAMKNSAPDSHKELTLPP